MVLKQNLRKPLTFLAAALAVAVSVAGCSSGPEPAGAIPAVACELVSGRDLWKYGPNAAANPFLPLTGMVRGTQDEFVVLRIRLSLAESTTVEIDGSVEDPTGKKLARLQTLGQMTEYWTGPENIPNRDKQVRSDTLTRYYPPDLHFVVKKGRAEYIVVFTGKSPLPRPAVINLSVTLNGEPQQFTFPLPYRK
jgi:hypothetical protein